MSRKDRNGRLVSTAETDLFQNKPEEDSNQRVTRVPPLKCLGFYRTIWMIFRRASLGQEFIVKVGLLGRG